MQSVIMVVFLLGAAMHFSLCPLHIFMPGELMIGKATNKDVNPAVRHFLAILGAAHGGFAAALVAAAFLSAEVRPQFACVTLVWYAILGPLVEAMRLEKPPTLWDCLNCCFASRSFSHLDKDGDGQITEEEWEEAQRRGVIAKNRKFSEMLAKGDRDGDGRINLSEFKTLHKAPTLNFQIVNAILLLALVADTGLSPYTIAAAVTMAVGALLFVITVVVKTGACASKDEEEDESVDEEEK
ncbi:hypothetical protein KFE25_000274 [Diacronema lutheri]|uniref:EF-hand domain-containing protein n=1 Tax=Diacronema lutheri TaxID=2081491 RepID=A0A8J6CAI1_DIALT|nr:hypothetical protein KFE25_000274 [Diacronema lutheri]|mmetsp:Transcript_2922/g.9117  ORF Transcript_2922/g.9117 Transcript_2922/m.9117 type:complete len:240 (-) Transcript_2922:185-904(-)